MFEDGGAGGGGVDTGGTWCDICGMATRDGIGGAGAVLDLGGRGGGSAGQSEPGSCPLLRGGSCGTGEGGCSSFRVIAEGRGEDFTAIGCW